MVLEDFRDSLLDEIHGIQSDGFEHIITSTDKVPSIDDHDISYPNLVEGNQQSKLLTSAVMFVDLRNSTSISLNHDQETLSKLYSSYVRSMTRCAHYFNGRVRNIIGDRVMVAFDRKDCFLNAINTAMLMNTVANYMLDREVSGITVEAGIGVDFGDMLVTKTGIIKRGSENTSNKSLVWLGTPANVASKLTDMANKKTNHPQTYVREGHYVDVYGTWTWKDVPMEKFIESLKASLRVIKHESPTFGTFHTSSTFTSTNPPILMTKRFHDGLADEHPNTKSVVDGFWKEQDLSVPGYSGKVYGGYGYYPTVAE